MRCRDVQALASCYIDGELDDARASALRGHVRQCEACLAAVRALGAIRDAAADLDTLEPPPSLWSAVQAGLAQAEIADAQRSRLWLHWQALKPRLLPGAVVVAAAAVVATWLWRPAAPPAPQHAAAPHAAPARVAEVGRSVEIAPSDSRAEQPAAEPFLARRQREVAEADQRYLQTLTELRSLVATERVHWPVETSARLDARLAALADQARQRQHTAALATAPVEDAADVRGRDALYAVYREEIELLQNVALYGAEALDEGGAEGLP